MHEFFDQIHIFHKPVQMLHFQYAGPQSAGRDINRRRTGNMSLFAGIVHTGARFELPAPFFEALLPVPDMSPVFLHAKQLPPLAM